MSRKQRVLILKADKPDTESTAVRLITALGLLDKEIEWQIGSYKDLIFYLNQSDPRIVLPTSGLDISDYDLVYPRDFRGYEFERNTCGMYLAAKKTKFINPDINNFQHISKLSQNMALALNGINIPRSIYSANPALSQKEGVKLGSRVVVKDIVGVGGSNNYLVSSEDIENTILSSNSKCIVQQFIPNSFDLRVTVVGDSIGTVCQRIRDEKNDHRNNVKLGSHKQFVGIDFLSTEARQACLAAAKVMGREIAGVDVIVTEDSFVILEVNLNFGMDSDDKIPPEVRPIYDHIKKRLSEQS